MNCPFSSKTSICDLFDLRAHRTVSQVYIFDGVGLNSQADPEPVKKEIQASG